MKRSTISGSKIKPAHLWQAFFQALGKNRMWCRREQETEAYVSTFTEQFKLAKAPYQLGERIV